MKYKNLFICTALFLQIYPVWGQAGKEWSLQDCIDYALEHNIQLQQNKLTELQGEADLEQKKADPVSLTFVQHYTESELPAPAEIGQQHCDQRNRQHFQQQADRERELRPERLMDRMGRRSNSKNIKAQKLQNQIYSLNTQQTANTIQEQIAQYYVQILYSKEALDVNKAMLETAQKQYRRGLEFYESGPDIKSRPSPNLRLRPKAHSMTA